MPSVKALLKAPLTAMRVVVTPRNRRAEKPRTKKGHGIFARSKAKEGSGRDSGRPTALLQPNDEPSEVTRHAVPSADDMRRGRPARDADDYAEAENSGPPVRRQRSQPARARSPLRACNDTMRALSPSRATSPVGAKHDRKPQHSKYARMASSESHGESQAPSATAVAASTALTAAPSATAATVNPSVPPTRLGPLFPPIDFGFGTLTFECLAELHLPRMTLRFRKAPIDAAGIQQMLGGVDAVLATGERFFVLFDVRSCSVPSASHRKACAVWSRDLEKWNALEERVSGIAFLLTSMLMRSTVNMMLSLAKPVQPNAVFANEADALKFAAKCGGGGRAPEAPRAHKGGGGGAGRRSANAPTRKPAAASPALKAAAGKPGEGEYLPARLVAGGVARRGEPACAASGAELHEAGAHASDPWAPAREGHGASGAPHGDLLDAADGWPLAPPLSPPRLQRLSAHADLDESEQEVVVLEDLQLEPQQLASGRYKPSTHTAAAGGCGCFCAPRWMRRWRCGRGGGALEDEEMDDESI